jgi:hypothetical protein
VRARRERPLKCARTLLSDVASDSIDGSRGDELSAQVGI